MPHFHPFAALLLVIAGCAVRLPSGQPLSDAAHVGGPGSDAQIFLPAGAGPHPAVVVLSGCDGVGPHHQVWSRRLASWGYVALLIDSFGPRGFSSLCGHGMRLPAIERARDAYRAADYLRGRPNVMPDRIGVIGFSHGGWTVMQAVLAGVVQRDEGRPFAAAVAYYPGCPPPRSPLVTDTLILIGNADDWTPAANCEAWRREVVTNGHVATLVVYHGARHGFDTRAPMHRFIGHLLGGDPSAAAAAEGLTRTFFAARLGAPNTTAGER